MRIAGVNKNSFIDYDGHISYVIFTIGCNMNCWYCHNRDIISGCIKSLNSDDIIQDIKSRVPFIDGVVISGGEPTLQPDLFEYIKRLKEIPIEVKLDTNGTRPEIVKQLVENKLIDFVAMDIKAPFANYHDVTLTDDNIAAIKETAKYLMQADIDYQFRTTVAPNLKDVDIISIARSLKGAKKLVLQQYVHQPCVIRDYGPPYTREVIQGIAKICEKYLPTEVKA